MTCGIYRIHCIANGRSYVGQSINIEGRWKEHKKSLQSGIHGNAHLQRAWNKYRASSFSFEVIAICDQEELNQNEQLALDQGVDLFNIYKVASSPLGYEHTSEAKEKNSRHSKEMWSCLEYRRKVSEGRVKQWSDPEFRKVRSEAMKGNQNAKGKVWSEEKKRLHSLALKGNRNAKGKKWSEEKRLALHARRKEARDAV